MNSCILMAEIIQEPQLRYTSDTQIPIAEMLVQFEAFREEDPPETLKVVGWGNLAQEIQEKFHQGDRVVLEGRLTMSMVDRPEGFKEKRAELTAQRIHKIGTDATLTATAVATPSPTTQPSTSAKSAKSVTPKSTVTEPSSVSKAPSYSASTSEADFDDIPF